MTSVKIDISKAADTQDAIKEVIGVRLKLEKILDALQHTNAKPNPRYTISYMVGNVGNVVSVRENVLCVEAMELGKRLAAAGVQELAHANPYAECVMGSLDYWIENKMSGNSLVITGSNIRYKKPRTGTARQDSPWFNLSDDVQIIVTRLELTDADYAEFRERQMKEALEAVKKLGYEIKDGVFEVV